MGLFGNSSAATRRLVEAFNDAYARRDVVALAPLLDDDARWLINGPVNLLHFCGERRGKREVLELVGRIAAEQVSFIQLVPEKVLIDGDCASTLCRLTGECAADHRVIGYRVAQFMRFRNGKIVDYCSVIDSFDAAEQVLGHAIDLPEAQPVANDAVVAV
jgi:ketosteroid isomerase-like protein